MKGYNQMLGAKGEKLARQFLHRQGYKIIARNFSCHLGEIDIIARQGKTTVFIEVKTRTSLQYGLPQEAIKKEKVERLIRCAQVYIENHAQPEGEFRFAVVAVVLSAHPQIQLIAID